jgi:hypothetical protein
MVLINIFNNIKKGINSTHPQNWRFFCHSRPENQHVSDFQYFSKHQRALFGHPALQNLTPLVKPTPWLKLGTLLELYSIKAFYKVRSAHYYI